MKIRMMISRLLYGLYAIKSSRLKSFIRWTVYKLERRDFYSATLRKIFKDYHGVEVGMYTHGGCFRLYYFDHGTTIGRYCSIAMSARALNYNHAMGLKSTHALFFNPVLKLCTESLVEFFPLQIGNDVWMGEGAIIMPKVTEIGDGAVVAAGAIVSKNVPPYAVVVGNPARVVRYRFSRDVIEELVESKWWEKDIEEILPDIEDYLKPYEKLYFERKRGEGVSSGEGEDVSGWGTAAVF